MLCGFGIETVTEGSTMKIGSVFRLAFMWAILLALSGTSIAGLEMSLLELGAPNPTALDTVFYDDYNRPDATGDIWGTPVVGGTYSYINPGNADFAIADSMGYLDDNANVGDPRAVSEIEPVTDGFTLDFSWEYEGGRGSGLLLHSGSTLVYGIQQEGYNGNLDFFNGSTWETIEPRLVGDMHNYRIDIVAGVAKVYIDDVLKLTTSATMDSFDQVHFWAQGMPDGLGTSDSWFDDVWIHPYYGTEVQSPPIEGIGQVLIKPFPNPALGSIQIDYVVSVEGRVQLEVFDIAGRLVVTLVDETKPAGSYSQIVSSLQSGVYFCHLLCSDGSSESARFVVIE